MITIAQIENNLRKLVGHLRRETFIYDLLLAYGLPKASITRLQKGNLNLSKNEGELSWKKKVLFKEELKEDLHITVSELATQTKHDQRFVIATDYKLFLTIDTKTNDRLDIDIQDLPKHYDFFLPWAGMEKSRHQNENPADIKAAEKMAKLFDEIKADNPDDSPEFNHGLNVFLSRLLFCLFAEDTGIFEDSQFINAISSHTQKDGSDLHDYLEKLFEVLDIPHKERKRLPVYLEAFPYVNGGLFRERLRGPNFTRRSRQAIIDSGELDWSAINPDIFGAMMQAVVTPEHRGGMGMHYTSVPNIMKVIGPLFLDDLKEAYEKAKGDTKKINKLLSRIYNIKIFDPACGSGNFLIIAYKELRRLEMQIFKDSGMMALSGITLDQFYGIELDDFAHEVAQLSLWLAEHQMNTEFFREFGQTNPTLPLKAAGKIVCGNACRLDWEKVCPKDGNDEIYILGNPPYLGSKRQKKTQKDELKKNFSGFIGYKNLDYISNWFLLGAKYIKGYNAKLAFVTTNSVVQGDHVALLWPIIFSQEIVIIFAHTSFKWGNNAKGEAGVACVIIGLGNQLIKQKFIISEDHRTGCNFISPYLTPNSTIIVYKRTTALSKLPEMCYGNMPLEGGYLKLSQAEKESFLDKYPHGNEFIRPLIGGDEFLQGSIRYALWIDDTQLNEALKIPDIEEKINNVKKFRINAGEVARSLITRSHQFRYRKEASNNFILVPCTSSEKREYLQCGFYEKKYITLNSAQIVYDGPVYIFGILSCKLHMLWSKATAGTLESRLRYSTQLCYNTFPFPETSDQRKQEITQCVFRILEEREKHPEKTLAQLYDPDKMPVGLREAHHQNDLAIERCYRSKPFESDEERLEFLFKLYEQMIEEEKNRGSLFEKQEKTRKRK